MLNDYIEIGRDRLDNAGKETTLIFRIEREAVNIMMVNEFVSREVRAGRINPGDKINGEVLFKNLGRFYRKWGGSRGFLRRYLKPSKHYNYFIKMLVREYNKILKFKGGFPTQTYKIEQMIISINNAHTFSVTSLSLVKDIKYNLYLNVGAIFFTDFYVDITASKLDQFKQAARSNKHLLEIIGTKLRYEKFKVTPTEYGINRFGEILRHEFTHRLKAIEEREDNLALRLIARSHGDYKTNKKFLNEVEYILNYLDNLSEADYGTIFGKAIKDYSTNFKQIYAQYVSMYNILADLGIEIYWLRLNKLNMNVELYLKQYKHKSNEVLKNSDNMEKVKRRIKEVKQDKRKAKMLQKCILSAQWIIGFRLMLPSTLLAYSVIPNQKRAEAEKYYKKWRVIINLCEPQVRRSLLKIYKLLIKFVKAGYGTESSIFAWRVTHPSVHNPLNIKIGEKVQDQVKKFLKIVAHT